MPDWDSRLYLKFESDRTRPPRDLLAQVPLQRARKVVDLGCGPGNSTELLVKRFPDARVIGLDSSPDMLQRARERLPTQTFVQADVAKWRPEPDTDLLFANATFQWVPDHPNVLKRLLAALPPGGVLAVQMPDNKTEPTHTLMAEVAREGGWAVGETEALQRGNPLDRKPITISCARTARRSTCGIRSMPTRSTMPAQSSNGSGARRCGPIRRRLRPTRARPISRPMRSASPISTSHATTAR